MISRGFNGPKLCELDAAAMQLCIRDSAVVDGSTDCGSVRVGPVPSRSVPFPFGATVRARFRPQIEVDMRQVEKIYEARSMLQDGMSDEAVETFTGVSLLTILALRAESAAQPWPEPLKSALH